MPVTDPIVFTDNLGTEFDVTTPTIELKLGAGLSKDAAGNLLATLAVTTTSCLVPVGYVVSNGTAITDSYGGATGTQTGTGFWDLTAPTGALVATGQIIEDRVTRDDIVLHFEDALATQIHVSQQDNGGAAGTVVNNGFVVIWYGLKDVVTGVTPV